MSSTGLTYFKFDPNTSSKKSALTFNFKTIHAKATVDLAYRAKEGKEIVVTVKSGKKIRFRCFVETILYAISDKQFSGEAQVCRDFVRGVQDSARGLGD
jgi:hypothetical protein